MWRTQPPMFTFSQSLGITKQVLPQTSCDCLELLSASRGGRVGVNSEWLRSSASLSKVAVGWFCCCHQGAVPGSSAWGQFATGSRKSHHSGFPHPFNMPSSCAAGTMVLAHLMPGDQEEASPEELSSAERLGVTTAHVLVEKKIPSSLVFLSVTRSYFSISKICCFNLFLYFRDEVYCSSGWSWTFLVAKADFELADPQASAMLGLPHQFYVVLEVFFLCSVHLFSNNLHILTFPRIL